MRGYPQFSFWISITLVKVCFSRIFGEPRKNTFELVGTALTSYSLALTCCCIRGYMHNIAVELATSVEESFPDHKTGNSLLIEFLNKVCEMELMVNLFFHELALDVRC